MLVGSFKIIFYHFALPIGFGILGIGILAVIKPEAMSKLFGISANGIALSYVMSCGIRDVSLGLIVLLLYYEESWRILGGACLFIGIVAVSDFLVVKNYGDRRTSLTHLFGAVIVIGYGCWLLMTTFR